MTLQEYSKSFYLLCLVAFFSMLSIMITNPVLSLFAKEIGATGVWIGYAVSGYWISRVVLEIPSGYFSSKLGYYRPMVFGLLLTVLGNALLVFVKDPFHLVLIRALKGFGAPFFFAVSMTFIIDLFEIEKRGRAMGIFQGIEFIGQIIGAGASGIIIEKLGWRGGFVTSLVLSIISLLLFIIPTDIKEEVVEGPTREPLKVSEVISVLKNQTLIIIALGTLAEFIMTSGLIMTVLGLYVRESLGFTISEIGYIMGARSIGFVTAMFTMGNISDRIGRKPVLLFGYISTAILIIIMSYFTTFSLMASVIGVMGFTSGAIWIVGPVISAEAVETSKRGAAIGAYRTFFDLGAFIGPIIMTLLWTEYGILPCFYLSAALLFINVPFTWMIKETGKMKGTTISY